MRRSPEGSIQYCRSTAEKGPSPCLQAPNEEEFIARPQKILYSALGLGLIFTVVLGFEKKKVSSPTCGCIMGREKIQTVRASRRETRVSKYNQNLSLDTQFKVN